MISFNYLSTSDVTKVRWLYYSGNTFGYSPISFFLYSVKLQRDNTTLNMNKFCYLLPICLHFNLPYLCPTFRSTSPLLYHFLHRFSCSVCNLHERTANDNWHHIAKVATWGIADRLVKCEMMRKTNINVKVTEHYRDQSRLGLSSKCSRRWSRIFNMVRCIKPNANQ